ncbi:MAG: hemerythrin [Clostridia bacterium]|jgi:hemerythrin|nr:hemerythrin [Clostridia bacterium]
MFDFKFDWDKSVEIGVPEIDSQHQELFRIGREVNYMLLINFNNITEDQLLTIVGELRNYITYHFYYEEAFMNEINYPNFLAHKNSHQNFKNKVNALDCDNLRSSFKILKELLVTWVFEHVLVEDYNLKAFINT